eukprot:535242_1
MQIMLEFILAAIFYNILHTSCRFITIPNDIFPSEIMQYLPLADQLLFKDINIKCRQCFQNNTKIQQIQDLHRIINIVNNSNIDMLTPQLKSLTNIIALNPLFSYYIWSILHTIQYKSHNTILSLANQMKLLNIINLKPAINLQAIQMYYESQQLMYVVSLLCISSRSIIDYKLNEMALFNNFPNTIIWFIYLYEHIIEYYSEYLNFTQNIYTSNSAIYLNKHYGFLVWNQHQLDNIKTQFIRNNHTKSIFGLHSKFGRLRVLMLRYSAGFHWKHNTEFESKWLIALVYKYNVPFVHGYINPTILRHKIIWLIHLAENNFKINMLDECAEIVRMLAMDELFNRDHLGTVLSHAIDGRFIVNALEILCSIRDDWEFVDIIRHETNSTYKQLLIKYVPKRQLTDMNNWNILVEEIERLSVNQWFEGYEQDSKNVIALLAVDKYFNAEHITNIIDDWLDIARPEWFKAVINVLCNIRDDWDYFCP